MEKINPVRVQIAEAHIDIAKAGLGADVIRESSETVIFLYGLGFGKHCRSVKRYGLLFDEVADAAVNCYT